MLHKVVSLFLDDTVWFRKNIHYSIYIVSVFLVPIMVSCAANYLVRWCWAIMRFKVKQSSNPFSEIMSVIDERYLMFYTQSKPQRVIIYQGETKCIPTTRKILIH